MGRLAKLAAMIVVTFVATGCGADDDAHVVGAASARPVPVETIPPYDGPSVHPERCRPDIRPEHLDTPNLDAVSSSRWLVELTGSCPLVTKGFRHNEASFSDGHVSVPDSCVSTGGRFRVDGRRFTTWDISTLAVGCSQERPFGVLEAVASWGVAQDGRLHLLDRDGYSVLVARAVG